MIRIMVTASPSKPEHECRSALLIKELAETGRLPMLSAALSPQKWTDGLGNCHEAAQGLMTDLIVFECADGWHWAIRRHQLAHRARPMITAAGADRVLTMNLHSMPTQGFFRQ